MPWVPNEEIRRFKQAFENCTKRTGTGVQVDTLCVRRVVKEAPEAAHRVVELYCVMAETEPSLLRTASIIATAYQIERGDEALLEMVADRAKKLGL